MKFVIVDRGASNGITVNDAKAITFDGATWINVNVNKAKVNIEMTTV